MGELLAIVVALVLAYMVVGTLVLLVVRLKAGPEEWPAALLVWPLVAILALAVRGLDRGQGAAPEPVPCTCCRRGEPPAG